MSATYRAIRLERFADSFREAAAIVDLPVVEPTRGEVRVRNGWCGVNGIFDTQLARNAVDYIRFELPTLTGVEACGVVEAIGDGVDGLAVGDAVAAMRFRGGYREINVAPADHFTRLPDASRESLALASTGVAALLALEHAGQLRDGETVAVSAAAGGLGHLIVQLAKRRGCRVVAVCGGEDKADFVRRLGADRVIDYRAESVADALRRDYPDAIDVAVDTVGGDIFDAFVANLAPHGRLVISGAARDMAGAAPAERIALRIYYKAARIQAFQNGLVPHLWPEARARLFALRAAGELRAVCDGDFKGLGGVFDAVEHLLSGRSIGKVVVDLRPNHEGD